MQWTDDGIVVAARRHGESAAIVALLTRTHGRHLGLVRGGAGRRQRGVLQPGNEVRATWRGRLAEHLGAYQIELTVARAAAVLDEPLQLAALSAACGLTDAALAEREPHPALFDAFRVLLAALPGDPAWPAVYVRWELGLLGELGFGLDLARCAVTGATEGLTHVSPKSGRAVSAEAAEPYLDKLLVLPSFLGRGPPANDPDSDVAHGLALTGYFLERYVFAHGLGMPPARDRFVARFSGRDTISSAIEEK